MDLLSRPANANCPIAHTLQLVGQKWSLLILREAFFGRTKFAEFQQIGVPTDTLTSRLDALVTAGIFERRTYRSEGRRAHDEYILTAAGRDLLTVLAALSQWGNKHLDFPDVQYEATTTGTPVHLAFVDDTGHEVPPADITVIP
ncbi:helix-turn-helix domain-containing protein [Kribbella sp. NPDC048915]|uniref:winged helix-turn-helix transcriptional regulator n=1 Tax=Kribbella sp. NPDC048915 TaxID=3155148 RepID=UPI0033ECBED9